MNFRNTILTLYSNYYFKFKKIIKIKTVRNWCNLISIFIGIKCIHSSINSFHESQVYQYLMNKNKATNIVQMRMNLFLMKILQRFSKWTSVASKFRNNCVFNYNVVFPCMKNRLLGEGNTWQNGLPVIHRCYMELGNVTCNRDMLHVIETFYM